LFENQNKKRYGVRETDNANDFYNKTDYGILYVLLTGIDSVAEHCDYILGFQFSFLLVKVALFRVNKADTVAGQENKRF